MKLCKSVAMFSLGGLLYGVIEILWRGHTHISMFVAGGAGFMAIWKTAEVLPKLGVIFQAALSALEITIIEFSVGVVVNILLGLNVWDYSSLPLNILGQVCLPFGALWFLLSIPALWLSVAVERVLFRSRITHMSILPVHLTRKKQSV